MYTALHAVHMQFARHLCALLFAIYVQYYVNYNDTLLDVYLLIACCFVEFSNSILKILYLCGYYQTSQEQLQNHVRFEVSLNAL